MKNKFEEQLKDIFTYSKFISDLEQYSSFKKFEDIWIELEIINALALDEWEQDGRPKIWDIWDEKYKSEAIFLIHELNKVLTDV